MKKLNNKGFTQKIIIAIIIIMSFNFIVPTYSRANFGGVLLGPIIDLVAGIGDSVIILLQVCMDGTLDNVKLNLNPFETNKWMIPASEFKDKIADYGMEPDPTLKNAEPINADDLDHGWGGWGTYSIPVLKYSPEKIFANEIPALDANFINPKPYTGAQEEKSIAIQLQEVISSWYSALRNLVIVGLLSVLLYVGIRMMLTSVSADKAKYKQMLMDWLIALCLLFFLHYIMSFTMTFIDVITTGLKGATDINVTINDSDIGNYTFRTNLTGYCRMQVEYEDFGARMVYLIFYIGLVVYTFMFTWKYMKRAITLAFLTLIAPLVTLTYPIDKIGDGKAQAFNMWLKEYIFNALLQPFHLIIYSVFLGSSMEIAIKNPLYAILFLAFITPAEKILRKFFGFEKATTAGASFAGGFGGAAAFNAVKGLVNKGAKSLMGGKDNKSGKDGIRTHKPVESDNSPSGYEAFAHGGNLGGSLPAGENDEEETPQQRIHDTNGDEPNNSETADTMNTLGTNDSETPDTINIPGLKPEVEPPRREGRFKRTIKGASGAAMGALRYTGNGLRKRFANGEWKRTIGSAAKAAGRLGVRTLTTGVGAAVGLGMGIAGDDLEDVLKYGAAGAALGGTALNGMVQGAGRRIANSGFVQAASQGGREAYYGGVNAAAIAAQDRELRESGEIRDYIGNNITNEDGSRLSTKQLNEYEDRAISHYDAGITDMSAIKKTLKLEDSIKGELEANKALSSEDRGNMAKEQAETIAKIADKVDDKKLMTDSKYAEGLHENFSRGLQKANPGMSQSELNKQADQMMKLLKKYKKVD